MKKFKDITEQYREEGRFKPVKPHMVKSVAAASPRKKNDSAEVKLKEEDMKEEVEQVDEIVKPQVKSDMKKLNASAFMKKHGVRKMQAKSMAEATAPEKEEPPFDPDPPKKKSVVAGKYGSGYSTARHLARLALQKQSEKYKKPVKESLEESRKAEIVKEIMKKKKAKSEDAFQSEPELSSTLTKV